MVTVGGLLDTIYLTDESASRSAGQSVTQEHWKPNDSLTKAMLAQKLFVLHGNTVLCCQEDLDRRVQALLTIHKC